MKLEEKIKLAITVPMYYKTYMDADIDLNDLTGSIPCKLHGEKHGESFSFYKEKGVWSCFGRCHKTGDVIDLHWYWHKLDSREAAIKSLASMLNIKADKIDLKRPVAKINRLLVDKTVYLNKCESLVKDIDSCIELDYIMSQLKMDSEIVKDLESFIERHGGEISKRNSDRRN